MVAITVLKILLKLTIWLLLTADLRTPNVLFGILIAVVLTRPHRVSESLEDWLQSLWGLVIMVPQAYFQAFAMILLPHRAEQITRQKVKPRRTSGLIFLDILNISFTPKTIVTRFKGGFYELHSIRRAAKSKTEKR